MKINPIIFFNIILALFLLIAASLTVFMIKKSLGIYYILGGSLVSLFIIFILYSINKGIPSSHRVLNRIEEDKNRIESNEKELIVDYPLLEEKQLIEWESIEAIYCLNMVPLDGTYHNFEYSFFLNKNSQIIKYSTLKWYNKLFLSSTKNGSFEVKIDDYSNRDFNKLHKIIEKYLIHKETSPEYLHKKFGNDKEQKLENDHNTVVSFPKNKPLKTFEIYKIYDRGSNIDNDKLKEYRNNAAKI